MTSIYQEAAFLLRELEHPELALEHAEWALNRVQKAWAKDFWEKVIQIIKTHLQ